MFESVITKANIHLDDTGISYEIPVLLCVTGHLDILVGYFLNHIGSRGVAWMSKVTASVKMFLEYLSVHENYDSEIELFENFRTALLMGTIGNSGRDPSGLWWSARSPNMANRIIGNLTDFFNWWAIKNPNSINPALSWTASKAELLTADAAYRYRRNSAILGHTWAPTNTTNGGKTRAKYPTIGTERSKPPAFPEERILDLVFKGFKVGNRFNFRDMLITILMNGAGFRESEPFHLYLRDVIEDPARPGHALVIIHHPVWGAAPTDPMWIDATGKIKRGNRMTYLAERYGITPRSSSLSTSHAGWKGGMHETELGGYYKQAYWFVPEFAKIFWQLWNKYIEQVALIPSHLRNHPYAFMNIAREPKGEVYKLGKFQDSHSNAVRRIGLEPSKILGTSEHGHRHAYAIRLEKAGVPPEMIRRFLHHTDIASQKVYTAPSDDDCVRALELALNRLNDKTETLRSMIDQKIAASGHVPST